MANPSDNMESSPGFDNVLSWLQVERDKYQPKKFNYAEEANKDAEYWEQQFDSYIQRLRVFPFDSLQFAQAACKLAATAVALAEHCADRQGLPKPGVSSGEIIEWSRPTR